MSQVTDVCRNVWRTTAVSAKPALTTTRLNAFFGSAARPWYSHTYRAPFARQRRMCASSLGGSSNRRCALLIRRLFAATLFCTSRNDHASHNSFAVSLRERKRVRPFGLFGSFTFTASRHTPSSIERLIAARRSSSSRRAAEAVVLDLA